MEKYYTATEVQEVTQVEDNIIEIEGVRYMVNADGLEELEKE